MYKTISWTIKNQDIIDILEPHCRFNRSPQTYIRSVLVTEQVIRDKARMMVSQINFPSIALGEQLKLSLYSEDAVMLRQAAKDKGQKVQQYLEDLLLACNSD